MFKVKHCLRFADIDGLIKMIADIEDFLARDLGINDENIFDQMTLAIHKL